jgi:hypothetical protein
MEKAAMKPKYQKPRCDCGKPLLAYRTEYWSVERYITKDGDLGNIFNIGTNLDDSDYQIFLHCRSCGKRYESDYDDKDRLIRADEI